MTFFCVRWKERDVWTGADAEATCAIRVNEDTTVAGTVRLFFVAAFSEHGFFEAFHIQNSKSTRYLHTEMQGVSTLLLFISFA